MNGMRMPIMIRTESVISPEYPPFSATPTARMPVAIIQNINTGLLRKPSTSLGEPVDVPTQLVFTKSLSCSIVRATSP
jgi:hypothetical protein